MSLLLYPQWVSLGTGLTEGGLASLLCGRRAKATGSPGSQLLPGRPQEKGSFTASTFKAPPRTALFGLWIHPSGTLLSLPRDSVICGSVGMERHGEWRASPHWPSPEVCNPVVCVYMEGSWAPCFGGGIIPRSIDCNLRQRPAEGDVVIFLEFVESGGPRDTTWKANSVLGWDNSVGGIREETFSSTLQGSSGPRLRMTD